MRVAVIGGGAAGFFSAIHAKENHPEAHVEIFEKSKKVLSKVRISGGGRCNVTNACTSIPDLIQAYPRGGKKLKRAFGEFNTTHTRNWFESRGVSLIAEEDQRVFPTSNTSQSIINCLLNETKRLRIPIHLEKNVSRIQPENDQLKLTLRRPNNVSLYFDKVIVATGGSPTRKGLDWLATLNHNIMDPVPSLFTFNMPEEPITRLKGVTVQKAHVHIQGTKFRSEGPLLITHWGMSGPAILKLSSYAARFLSEKKYVFHIQISWGSEPRHDQALSHLQAIANAHPGKYLKSFRPFDLPGHLWHYLLEKSKLPVDKRWEEIGKNIFNKLATILTNDIYKVSGKTTFKEEFVTCGGISLNSIDFKTMQSKSCKHLYFAGEILDIDAITGGYNFQAAWTTGFIAGQLK